MKEWACGPKLKELIFEVCGLTGSREHLDPQQCLLHVKKHMGEQLGWIARQGCEDPSPDEMGHRRGVCGHCPPCEARDRLREAGLPVPFQCAVCGATKPCRHVTVGSPEGPARGVVEVSGVSPPFKEPCDD